MKPRTIAAPIQGAVLLVVALFLLPSSVWARLANDKSKEADSIKVLLRQKVATLEQLYGLAVQAHSSGTLTQAKVREARAALLTAQLELCETNEERVKLLQEMLKEAEAWEKQVAKLVAAGEAPTSEALQARVARLESQIALEKAKKPK